MKSTTPFSVIVPPRGQVLGGVDIHRLLPWAKHRAIGPFVFLDHVGPAVLPPGGLDVGPHPHIGLATLTWLYSGQILHRDSVGSRCVLRPGAVNWMTAGRGITHSERSPDEAVGEPIHAIQVWVALPQAQAEMAPAFAHHPADTLPRLKQGGLQVEVLAGRVCGAPSPVAFPGAIWMAAVEADPMQGGALRLDADIAERGVFAVTDGVCVNGQPLAHRQLGVLRPGDAQLELAPGAKALLLGGDPLDGPRLLRWNFVASSRERLDQAEADWKASMAAGFRDSVFALPPDEREGLPMPGR